MKSNYYGSGYYAQHKRKNNYFDINYDQRKCIFHPNISDTLIDSILDSYELKELAHVGITEEMIIDTFKLFYLKDKTVIMKPSMYWLHHFLKKCDNHILTMVTNNNPGFSHIAAYTIIDALYKYLKKEMPDKNELNANLSNGSGTPELDKVAKAAFNRAKKAIQNTQDTAANFGCSKSFGSQLDEAKILGDPKLLKKLANTSESLSKFVKYIIDKAVSYSQGRKYIVEESIFESDDIEDIANIENFSHVALLNDLSVQENKYFLNFDIFIDDSGSMGCQYNIGGSRIELRTLARMVAFKMYSDKIIKDIWIFACRGELFKIPIEEMFTAKIDGGTDISQCLRKSNQTNRPCLIITDGNDTLDTDLKYNKQAYIVALEVDALSKDFIPYAKNNQVLFYSSNKGFSGSKILNQRYAPIVPINGYY